MIRFFLHSEDRERSVSALAAVEVRSAIRRRQFAGDTSEEQASLAIQLLGQETRRLTEHPITAAVIAEATSLVDRHGLKSLDSIQLASAIIMRRAASRPRSILFVSSDRKLLIAAQADGFNIWVPFAGPLPQ